MKWKTLLAVALILLAVLFIVPESPFQAVPGLENVSQVNVTYVTDRTYTKPVWIITFTPSLGKRTHVFTLSKSVVQEYGFNETYPEATIEITITRHNPIFRRDLKVSPESPIMVTPKTYPFEKTPHGWLPIDDEDTAPAFYVTTYEWAAEVGWEVHILLDIHIVKKVNGVVVEEKTIEAWDAYENIGVPLEIVPGKVYLEYLGIRDYGRGAPSWGDILIVGGYIENTFRWDAGLKKVMAFDEADNSFSYYWYGKARATYKGERAVWLPASPKNYPGWKVGRRNWLGVVTRWEPVQPTLQELVDYLESQGYKRYTLEELKGDYFKTVTFHHSNPYIEAEAYMDTLTGMFKLVVDADYAETYTYRVEVGKPHISNVYWEDTGTTHTEITGRATAVVEVENTGTAGGEFVVRAYIQPEDTPAYVSPESHQIALDPGETTTLKFDVINKGTDKDVEGTLVIEMIETATAEKDTSSLSFTLKSTYGLPYTYLYVYTYDKTTEERVPGIEVTVNYGHYSDTATTDESGVAFFDLGNYTGPVTIKTTETDKYMASTLRTTVTSGENHKIVELIPKEEAAKTLRSALIWMAIGALIVAVVVASVIIVRRVRR